MLINIPIRAEVVLRTTWIATLAYILSVQSSSSESWNVVPPSFSYLVGAFGSIIAIMLPKYCFGIGAVMPTMLAVIAVCLLLTSVLLAAATVSSALMVAVYACMTMLLTGLYFGPDFEKTIGFANVLIFMPGLLSLSLRHLVQEGFTVLVQHDNTATLHDTFGLVKLVLSNYCLKQGQAADCWESSDFLLNEDSSAILIPRTSSDLFGGQTAYVTTSSSNNDMDGIEIHLPGGLWIVQRLWTWHGVDNPLAIFQNMLIMICWVIVCFTIGMLTPPWRTARDALSRHVVPAALQMVSHRTEIDREKLYHFWQVAEDGSMAGVTTFEPRLCRAPFEYIVPQLKNLLIQTELTILSYLLRHSLRGLGQEEGGHQVKTESDALLTFDTGDHYGPDAEDQTTESDLHTVNALLQNSAEALRTMDASSLIDSTEEGISDADFFAGTDHSPSRFLLYRASQVRQRVLEWIQVMQQPVPTSLPDIPKNLYRTYWPWIASPILAFKDVPALLLIPFEPSQWSRRDFLWSFKLAFGFVLLFAMTIYWDAYAHWAIQVGARPVGTLFYGWHLGSYAFAYRPTAEGTFKKGLQRLVGTCAGGFLAWLGIILCSGSFDDSTPVNPYALVVWLALTMALITYVSIDKGPVAQKGVSVDHGFVGLYGAFTCALISLEFYAGKESRDNLVINRVVATLTGVLMAIAVAFFPPAVVGQAKHSLCQYFDALEEDWAEILEYARIKEKDETNEESPVSARKPDLDNSSFRRRKALFMIKDAGSLKALPIFRLGPSYGRVVGQLTVTESMMHHFLERLDHAPISPADMSMMKSLIDSEDLKPHNKMIPGGYVAMALEIQNRLRVLKRNLVNL